jgi:hypothetical protein
MADQKDWKLILALVLILMIFGEATASASHAAIAQPHIETEIHFVKPSTLSTLHVSGGNGADEVPFVADDDAEWHLQLMAQSRRNQQQWMGQTPWNSRYTVIYEDDCIIPPVSPAPALSADHSG